MDSMTSTSNSPYYQDIYSSSEETTPIGQNITIIEQTITTTTNQMVITTDE